MSNDDRRDALAAVPVSRETEALFEQYVDMLRRWQAAKNLVGPGTLDSVWLRHLADSAQLFALAPDSATTWVDIGSGAGFPGLVMAIMGRNRPGFRVHLIESNGRKCAFLREVARILKLPATIHNGRVEDVLPTLPGPVHVLSARALAPLDSLLRLGGNLLTTGTLGLFPKGQDVGDELTQAAKYWSIRTTTVPSKTDSRGRILVVERAEPRVVS
ncbi:16S rRNA (guanine(527)-N(7))-methyltransferase RsmG [Alsobacter sp. R-9]